MEISVYKKCITIELQYRTLKYITPNNETHYKKYKNLLETIKHKPKKKLFKTKHEI